MLFCNWLYVFLIFCANSCFCWTKDRDQFDFVCNKSTLYKPYVHIYEGLGYKNLKENITEPCLIDIENRKNIKVCINGPAYLYYSKTTSLGTVFETPRMDVYDHICEAFNVPPAPGSTHPKMNRTLMAILLMGDENNYYLNPALDLFTAPYYDKAQKLYVNATSIIVFGDDNCFLEKDGKSIMITPPPSADPNERYYCKLGYTHVLDADPTAAADAAKYTVKRILRNDFELRNGGCGAGGWEKSYESFTKLIAKLRGSLFDKEKAASSYVKATLDTQKQKLVDSMADADKIIADPKTTPKDKNTQTKKKAADQKELNKVASKLKLMDYFADQAYKDMGAEKTPLNASHPVAVAIKDLKDAGGKLKAQEKALRDAYANDDDLRAELEGRPQDFDTLKVKIKDNYSNANKSGIKDILDDLATQKTDLATKWEALKDKAKAYIEAIATVDVYTKNIGSGALSQDPIPPATKSGIDDALESAKNSTPQPNTILMKDVMDPATECIKMEKVEDACKNAKPDIGSCSMFTSSLGRRSPSWTPGDDGDLWKNDILDLIESIFTNACFRLPNRFTRNVHRIFKYYLTSPDHFNHNKNDLNNTANSNSSNGNNKKERDYWKYIKDALTQCKQANHQLFFKRFQSTQGDGWMYLRKEKNATVSELSIPVFSEQAEEEFFFNWVIDVQYKIFATVLGLCMPDYETKVPLITARFYVFYTEDFITPLRTTWVDDKDNRIFDYILGEFKNGEADLWVKNCMEAAYLQADLQEYRPPRCLLVNQDTEYNYYTTGPFAGSKGKFSG